MTVKYHQISLKETFSDCQDIFFDDTPSFSACLKNTLTFPSSFRQLFITLFISPSAGNVSILSLVSSRLLFCRRSSPFPRIPFLSSSFPSVRNLGISAAFPKSLMPLSSHALNRTSFLILK